LLRDLDIGWDGQVLPPQSWPEECHRVARGGVDQLRRVDTPYGSQPFRRVPDERRLIPLAPLGHRRQYGPSVSMRRRSSGTARTASSSVQFLNVTMP
jgi:hypothetical protein